MFIHRLNAEDSVDVTIQEMQKRKQALVTLFKGRGESMMALTKEVIGSLLASIS